VITPRAATQEEVRRHNLGRLLRLLHIRGGTSRAELTALTRLNRSTVRALTSELVEAGLVRESAPVGRGAAGRPSIRVEPESERVFVLAIDVGVERVVAARIGLGGVVLDRRGTQQVRGDSDPPQVLHRLKVMVGELLSAAPVDARCVGAGVSVCGVVDSRDGTVRFAPNVGWVDVPFGPMLADHLGLALIAVGNDADLGVMAEHLRGAAADASDAIYLSGEVGVGGGIILGGQPLVGAGGYAGEVGHMSVNPEGRICRCGRRGCWETEVGEDGVFRSTGIPPEAGFEQVLAAYAAGDGAALAGVRRAGHWLGVGVVDLVNIFNPQVIVFGGAVRHIFSLTEQLVKEALATALAAPRAQVRLAPPALGADSTLVGAAELAFARLLEDPLGTLTTPTRTEAAIV
jgi:predicted NBD/HSP70 family sugar kinase